MSMKIATCVAPVNIAVTKYWGKRDENLILPLNDSISGTLSIDQMCAKTTVATSPNFTNDRMWLNGVEEKIDNPRLRTCLAEIKKRAKSSVQMDGNVSWKVHICSENNFPTAAGLASSAAGYACLVYSLAQLYDIEGDVSTIARQGSGSACRSLDGGFVQWIAGTKADGSDSLAKQIVPEVHWPEMRVLILVVSDSRKKTSSTSGMQRSVETSDLLKHRVNQCIGPRTYEMTKAIKEKDFEKFAELTMKDSNQFHAVCLDTYPPCVYMNDVSHSIANLVHAINKAAGKNVVAYTFDAGPNACLYLLDENVEITLSAIKHLLPSAKPIKEYYKGMDTPLPSSLVAGKGFDDILKLEPWPQDSLRYIIHTKVGPGPKTLSKDPTDVSIHLLNVEGLPKKLN